MSDFEDLYEGLEPLTLSDADELLGAEFTADVDYAKPPTVQEADSWLTRVRKPAYDADRIVEEAERALNTRLSSAQIGNFKDVLSGIMSGRRQQEAPWEWAAMTIRAMNLKPSPRNM